MEHILNQTNHYNRTVKYQVVTSQNIINFMEANDFVLTKMDASRVVKKDKDGFQKHLMRFASAGDLNNTEINKLRPEIVIMNSYDGSQSIRVMLGLYRLVCSNGLVVGNSVFSYRVRHIGDTYANLRAALELCIQSMPTMMKQVEAMQKTLGNESTVNALKYTAASILLPKRGVLDTHLDGLNMARRFADRDTDLFTAFNRVQENALKGRLEYQKLDKNNIPTWRKVKVVKSLDKQIELNQNLWEVAVRLAA